MKEFVRKRIQIGETAATIAAPSNHIESATEAIREARVQVQRQILRDSVFLTTLEPYACAPDAGPVVRRMCEAAETAGVGPMAAVAGTVAQAALEAMIDEGCRHGWVDNGGDVCLVLEEPVTLEILVDPASSSALAIDLEPTNGVLGICSSSGRFGHSISLGDSDITLVMAESAPLADALATAVGNRVRDASSLASCFEPFGRVKGFISGFAAIDGAAAMHGSLPRIAHVEHNPDRMTAHSSMSSCRYFERRSLDRRVRA